MKITEVRFNWCHSEEAGEDWTSHIVGQHGVKSITDCSEERFPVFRVRFDDGKEESIFNPNRAFHSTT